MEVIVVEGRTKDRDRFEAIYEKAVEAYNSNLGHKKVWIVFDDIAIRLFPGFSLEEIAKKYKNIVDEIKKR